MASIANPSLRMLCRCIGSSSSSRVTPSTVPALVRFQFSSSSSSATPPSPYPFPQPSYNRSTPGSRQGRTPFRDPKDYDTIAQGRQPAGINPIFAKLRGSGVHGRPPTTIPGFSNAPKSKREEMQASKRKSADVQDGIEGLVERKVRADSPEALNASFAQTIANSRPGSMSTTRIVPCTTTSARSLSIGGATDYMKQYRRLMAGVIAANNVRQELRLNERYEKPKYKRQRLRSNRHRRRFARDIGMKVAAVMRAKSQGM